MTKRLRAVVDELLRVLKLEEEWDMCKTCYGSMQLEDGDDCPTCLGVGAVVFLEPKEEYRPCDL